jgi:proline racemase
LRPVIIGSKFVCRIAWPTAIGGRPALVLPVSGRVWITGVNWYMLHTADAWPSGDRLTDAWPRIREAI